MLFFSTDNKNLGIILSSLSLLLQRNKCFCYATTKDVHWFQIVNKLCKYGLADFKKRINVLQPLLM